MKEFKTVDQVIQDLDAAISADVKKLRVVSKWLKKHASGLRKSLAPKGHFSVSSIGIYFSDVANPLELVKLIGGKWHKNFMPCYCPDNGLHSVSWEGEMCGMHTAILSAEPDQFPPEVAMEAERQKRSPK